MKAAICEIQETARERAKVYGLVKQNYEPAIVHLWQHIYFQETTVRGKSNFSKLQTTCVKLEDHTRSM